MITSVITNGIAVCLQLMITTTTPIPCPDGIDGCLVNHEVVKETKKYVPLGHGADEYLLSRGVCLREGVSSEILDVANYFCCGKIIPVYGFDSNNKRVIGSESKTPIGFIYRDALESYLSKIYKDKEARNAND